MTTYSTILLDRDTWGPVIDSGENIAVATPAYALAQDVASAIKTFLGECYYDTTLGVPYFGQILGHNPPLAVFKAQMVAAAKTVPGVVSAVCYVTSYNNRAITGQVQFVDEGGYTQAVTIPSGTAPPAQKSVFTLDGSLLDGSDVLE